MVDVVLWIAQGLLAAAFVAAGTSKLLQPRERPRHSSNWAQEFPPIVIKTISVLEIVAALGLVLPAVLDIVTVLTPAAATGVAGLMIGAVATHSRRAEWRPLGLNLVLLALAAFVAWGRFGPYAF